MNYPSFSVPSTYYYNDGTYEGMLNLSNCFCSPPMAGAGGYYMLTIYYQYYGIVQIK